MIVKSLSHIQLFVTPWTVANQAPPSMGFSRQEYWSGLPFSSPGGLLDPRIKPESPALQAGSLPTKQFLDEETNENCSVSFNSGNVIIKITLQLECVCAKITSVKYDSL